ncbi:hypothetical protein NPX13_g10758 [Xylaria arbuscula]|uniref:Uncharacterized protein n=1 Tax=Xylaria arbuscula TaxID=114810 RepID=A0A9W8THL3_9PEZI|nr:hypothetical protein NPX13_g10758 [Xylaria arbuscula]
MSEKRHVKFSPSPPAGRGILKNSDSHSRDARDTRDSRDSRDARDARESRDTRESREPREPRESRDSPRDSGVGSSSSDHTGSSGSLEDERFTDRDYNIQSNNVDALREALSDTIKDIDNWKARYLKKNDEQIETRRKLKNTDNRYRDACEQNDTMRAQLDSMEDRMAKQDRALEIANARIRELESNFTDKSHELANKSHELDEWKDRYKQLHVLFEATRHSAEGSVASGGSGELSVGRSRSEREKRDSTDMTSRMKQRINRDQPDSGSSHGSKSSRSSEATVSSKRSSHRTNASTDDKPYIEKMPRASTSALTSSGLTSPRHPGSYTLTTASNTSSARKHGTSSSSRSHHRENGDYIAHPLPLADRSRHS